MPKRSAKSPNISDTDRKSAQELVNSFKKIKRLMTKAQVRTIDSRDVREFISKLLRWPKMPEKQLSHNSLSAIDSKTREMLCLAWNDNLHGVHEANKLKLSAFAMDI